MEVLMSVEFPPPLPQPGKSGKIYDPVFLCMLAAVVLAVVSSILVRAVSGGAHQANASGTVVPNERAGNHPLDPDADHNGD
jgi:hypothetical protein